MSEPVFSRTFSSKGEFQAWHDACEWLEDAGFSVGRMQRGSPCGILFGHFDIQKWRNLSAADRAALDGIIKADPGFRRGPVTVEIWSACPLIGVELLLEAEGRAP